MTSETQPNITRIARMTGPSSATGLLASDYARRTKRLIKIIGEIRALGSVLLDLFMLSLAITKYPDLLIS